MGSGAWPVFSVFDDSRRNASDESKPSNDNRDCLLREALRRQSCGLCAPILIFGFASGGQNRALSFCGVSCVGNNLNQGMQFSIDLFAAPFPTESSVPRKKVEVCFRHASHGRFPVASCRCAASDEQFPMRAMIAFERSSEEAHRGLGRIRVFSVPSGGGACSNAVGGACVFLPFPLL